MRRALYIRVPNPAWYLWELRPSAIANRRLERQSRQRVELFHRVFSEIDVDVPLPIRSVPPISRKQRVTVDVA